MRRNPAGGPRQEHQFEEYIVFRDRLRDLLRLFEVMLHVHACDSDLTKSHLDTLRLLSVTHVAGFFDKRRGTLKLFEMWKRYFPNDRDTVDNLAAEITPVLKKALEVRHNVGAHANISIEAQNLARADLTSADTQKLMLHFMDVALALAKKEKDVPGLAEAIASWGLPPGEELTLGEDETPDKAP